MRASLRRLCLFVVVSSCATPGLEDGFDAGVVHPPRIAFQRAPGRRYFCDLPLDDVTLSGHPSGFCVRRFATVPTPRVLAFAPNGDLFVASPRTQTPGGAPQGRGAIVVLADDDRDGAPTEHTFASGLADVHGLRFGRDGALYLTLGDGVYRASYTPGQRALRGTLERVVSLAGLAPGARWTHTLAQAADGTMYVSVGQYASFTCPSSPYAGAILRVPLDRSDARAEVVASGFRNPMYLQCDTRSERCYAAELSDDAWDPASGVLGREKLVRIAGGEDYGYPCCAGQGATAPAGAGRTDCRGVHRELESWPLHDTPFGMAFAPRGVFPQPYDGGFFVALHGAYGSWANTKIVFSPVDPQTGHPTGAWRDFVTGWGVSSQGIRGRLTDLAFAPDGRLFFSDDQGGAVYWVAPEPLAMP